MAQARFERWYRRSTTAMARHDPRAGSLSVVREGVHPRRIHTGGLEVAQAIYIAACDEAWNTIPALKGGPLAGNQAQVRLLDETAPRPSLIRSNSAAPAR